MPTNRCTAACKHCGTLSSPRATDSLTSEQIHAAIREGADLGIRIAVFTGGEPTLALDILLSSIDLAASLGMLTRVVTNCHWAMGDEISLATLRSLREAGLTEINFSTGDQHTRFVPIIRVLRAIRAALKFDYSPAVMVEMIEGCNVSRETVEQHPYYRETLSLFPNQMVTITESPWMPLNTKRRHEYPPGVAVDNNNVAARRGCDSVLQTLTVQADGKMGACCGLGLSLIPELNLGQIGRIPMADAIRTAEEDLLKRWIRAEGPERIIAWAAGHDESISWEGMYAHRCQACLRLYKDEAIRKVIRERYMEKIPDVLFTEWLIHEMRTPSSDAAPLHKKVSKKNGC
ncbi:radical SAM protein [Streptomyces sp. MBT53]|uniref:radical SAM protein n=1 Tax=Streptomyces sp. MBT53 TaxID=1488384 RepID=UPI001F412B41|nr:radical SAM protein [Streptomyces sp. MBT53]